MRALTVVEVESGKIACLFVGEGLGGIRNLQWNRKNQDGMSLELLLFVFMLSVPFSGWGGGGGPPTLLSESGKENFHLKV